MLAASNSDDTARTTYLSNDDISRAPPRHGRLTPLKTCLETQALNQTVEAHVVEIPTSSANTVLRQFLRALQEAIPDQDAVSLQHLRRFAKPDFLPDSLKRALSPTSGIINDDDAQEKKPPSLDQEDLTDTSFPPGDSRPEPSLHLLVCAASIISTPDLASILAALRPFSDSPNPPSVRTIPVPLLPPTSEEQAARWSRIYWPTVYKRNNPFGPHPSLVSRAEAEIRPQVDGYMALATQVGREVHEMGLGVAVGAVIVERKAGVGPVVLAVAGDGRWIGSGRNGEIRRGNGNVMAHAVMRAIGMIARKRREVARDLGQEVSGTATTEEGTEELPEDDVFADYPTCDLERVHYTQTPIAPNGYLCLDLEIYISHEPCVMCSMAINHSRFGRVVFGRRLPRSGGLTSEMASTHGSSPAAGMEKVARSCEGSGEPGLGYGLFWRPGLNWKLLAWEWRVEDGEEADGVGQDVHV